MNYKRLLNWIAGGENLSEINRAFNAACVIGGLFCFLSAVECYLASLSPILVASNFLYTIVLGLSFYYSRFRQNFRIWRIISVFVLIIIYTPILWIFNGGIHGATPYFIPLFVSFLTIMTITRKGSKSNTIISTAVITTFCFVVVCLVVLEFQHPEIIYQYTDPVIHMIDIIVGVLFSSLGNYMIIMAFVHMYYRQLDKVEELAIRDSMTNLYNHVFAIARLTEEIDRASRNNSPLSIIMLDIDHFKEVNDSHGHIFGDEVLKQISHALQSNCRSVDIVARYGGEEILIILPDTTKKTAGITGNRLLNLIRKMQFDNQVSITASAGVAQYKTGETASDMIEQADTLLYDAKDAGRDQLKY